jgi:hypothetical protein
VFKKALLYTCSITWAFGKKSGSSFIFSPTDRKDTSPLKDRLEEIEQKLEEIRTKALEPLKLLVSTKAILFTRSINRAPEINPGVLYIA